MSNDQSGKKAGPDYSYAANHNLVLHTDRSNIPRRDNEPTGEPTSLAGLLSMQEMGSRAMRDKSMLESVKQIQVDHGNKKQNSSANESDGLKPSSGATKKSTGSTSYMYVKLII